MRKKGINKTKKNDPIVQMGLAMDGDGIPLHYELFPGNVQDKSTFRKVIGEVRREYNTGRIIVVGDKGVITGDNIFYLAGGEKLDKTLNGYVLSYSIRGSSKEFKEYVLDESGYLGIDGKAAEEGADFKIKSELIAREINVTMQSGKTETKIMYEKQIVFWGKKYADKAKAERALVLEKAKSIVEKSSRYKSATKHGAAKYIKDVSVDKATGEVITPVKALLYDESKALEGEKYDGYYSIVTSEKHMSDGEIIDTYRGLWEIEETFKITKSELEARPVHVTRPERIDAHFLSCFISLVLIRLLQKQTGRQHSVGQLIECLNRISCSHESENIYLFDYFSEMAKDIGEAVGIDFSKKRMRTGDIRSLVGEAKKQSNPQQSPSVPYA